MQSASSFGETTFSGGGSLGIEYDSNVAVDEIERSSGLGDTARMLNVDLAIDHRFTDDTKGSLSYGYSEAKYAEFEQLSRTTEVLGANFSTKVGKVTLGANYFNIDAELDGQPFLTYERASPSISGFMSKRWFGRAAYVWADKTIENRPGRDAMSHSMETDLYYFWQGLRKYINVGYVYKKENSQAARFDYSSHAFKVRYQQRITIKDTLTRFEISARYELRDYSSITPLIGTKRNDDRLRLRAEYKVPISEHLSWNLYGGYSDYQSNLPTADYEQNVIGSSMEFEF